MGISTNISQILFAENSHVRCWQNFSMLWNRYPATTWHQALSRENFVTWHVATCLSEVPPRKQYVGALGAVCHKNRTRQEHQMSAVGKWMSQARRTRGHVAHVLLHVRPQGVIFVINLTAWRCSSCSLGRRRPPPVCFCFCFIFSVFKLSVLLPWSLYIFLSHPWWRYRNTFLTITLTTLSSNMTNWNIHFPLSTGSAIYTIYTTNIVRYRLFLIHLFSMMQLKKWK